MGLFKMLIFIWLFKVITGVWKSTSYSPLFWLSLYVISNYSDNQKIMEYEDEIIVILFNVFDDVTKKIILLDTY